MMLCVKGGLFNRSKFKASFYYWLSNKHLAYSFTFPLPMTTTLFKGMVDHM